MDAFHVWKASWDSGYKSGSKKKKDESSKPET
jgi:hypothetical protein